MELDYWIQLLYAWHSHWHIADAQWVVVEVNIILCCVLRKLVEFIFFFLELLSNLLVLSRAKHPWLWGGGVGAEVLQRSHIAVYFFQLWDPMWEKSCVMSWGPQPILQSTVFPWKILEGSILTPTWHMQRPFWKLWKEGNMDLELHLMLMG